MAIQNDELAKLEMTEVFFQDHLCGITCIDTMLGRQGMASCYLIEQDGMLGFIDTGTNNSVSIMLEVLRRKGFEKEQVAYIMPTHVHLDHAGGVGGLMKEFSNAQLVVHPRGVRHMIDPSKLEAGSLAVYGEEVYPRIFGNLIPVDPLRVIRAEDEMVLNFNGRELLFIDTPGHARHHYCIFDKASNGFFTGDTFGASYPQLNSGRAPLIFPPTTPVQFDPEAWTLSLKRLMSFKPERVFLTHYGMHLGLSDLATQLRLTIKDYADIAREYAGHSQRTERIASALLQGSVNHLLDQQCGVSETQIRELLAQDMSLNAQGLDFWLTCAE